MKKVIDYKFGDRVHFPACGYTGTIKSEVEIVDGYLRFYDVLTDEGFTYHVSDCHFKPIEVDK